MKITHSKTGFTLIEVIIYSALAAIFLTASVAMFSSALSAKTRTQAVVELSHNAMFISRKLESLLVGATAINSPAAGQTAGSLSFNVASSSLNPIIVDMNANQIRLKKGSAPAHPINSDHVSVASLSFTNYTFSQGATNTVRVRGKLVSAYSGFNASHSFDWFINVR